MMTKCPISVCKTVRDVNKPPRVLKGFSNPFPQSRGLDDYFLANPRLNKSSRFPHLRRTNRGQMWATYDKSK